MSCKQEACCCVFTAQHSIDESGQMSWQGDLDIPISYGTFSRYSAFCQRKSHTACFLLAPDKKSHSHFTLKQGPAECPWLIVTAQSLGAECQRCNIVWPKYFLWWLFDSRFKWMWRPCSQGSFIWLMYGQVTVSEINMVAVIDNVSLDS